MTTFQQITELPVSAPASIPHSVDAEQAVIGSLFITQGESFHECRLILSGGGAEFYIHRNRYIWEAVETLVKNSTSVDILTVSDSLEKAGTLADVGGFAYLTNLVSQVPSSLHAADYAAIVHEKHIRRQMIAAANTTASLAYDETKTLEEAAAGSNRALTQAINLNSVKNNMSLSDALLMVDRTIEENGKQEEAPGIPTPWADYNKLLGGGAQKSDLNLVIGRPGKGKTSFLMQVARHAAKYGEGMRVKRNHVAVFSLEMPIDQLTIRLIAQMSGLDFQIVRSGKFNDVQYEKYIKAIDELSDLDITLDYKPGASPEYIRSRCELLASQSKLDMICVDSLNLMKSSGNFRGREFAEADECAKGLKNIAGDFSVPIWCAHQMNRDNEKRGDDSRPKLSDMRDGGEQPVDGAMFIWHQMDGDRISRSWFVQEKQRNGPTGDVPITFLPQSTRFENYTGVRL